MPSFIIARAPYRVSFFGGGTDYPVWYRDNPGAVLATSIDKYSYILCRWLPPFFEHKYHIVYSEIERPQERDQIKHAAVRETLKLLDISDGVEIHHAGDLSARTGMGTSSAFTVALLNALYTLKGTKPNKMTLALDAIHIEQIMAKEHVGSQDQTTSAFGGFNRIDFGVKIVPDLPLTGKLVHNIKVTPIKSQRLKELESCLMLFFTGFSRTASQIAKMQIERVAENRSVLMEMYEMVDKGVDILTCSDSLIDFGKLLDESWRLKRSLTSIVSTEYIDYLYAKAIGAGAVGGKLLGAGGGGFLLFFVEPDLQGKVKESLSSLVYVPFKLENSGSQIHRGGEIIDNNEG